MSEPKGSTASPGFWLAGGDGGHGRQQRASALPLHHLHAVLHLPREAHLLPDRQSAGESACRTHAPLQQLRLQPGTSSTVLAYSLVAPSLAV
jgi:hypothetical protein